MVILRSVVSCRTIGCLVVVLAGFIVGCEGEVQLSKLGIQWGLISSVAVSLNAIYTKKVRHSGWVLFVFGVSVVLSHCFWSAFALGGTYHLLVRQFISCNYWVGSGPFRRNMPCWTFTDKVMADNIAAGDCCCC